MIGQVKGGNEKWVRKSMVCVYFVVVMRQNSSRRGESKYCKRLSVSYWF